MESECLPDYFDGKLPDLDVDGENARHRWRECFTETILVISNNTVARLDLISTVASAFI